MGFLTVIPNGKDMTMAEMFRGSLFTIYKNASIKQRKT